MLSRLSGNEDVRGAVGGILLGMALSTLFDGATIIGILLGLVAGTVIVLFCLTTSSDA